MAWKISGKAFLLLNTRVASFTVEEDGKFQAIRTWPGYPVLVRDIVLCEKTTNARNHVVWGRVKALRGLDCHSFVTTGGKRYDSVNDFKIIY